MSPAPAIVTILSIPRGNSQKQNDGTIYEPRPSTPEERELGLHVMIGSLIGMVLLGLWVLYMRWRKKS